MDVYIACTPGCSERKFTNDQPERGCFSLDTAILDRLHENMLDIYHEIARICDKHGLTYFVVGGTLLGAVVHKNYIPWDDDLDIAMPRDDYDQFINEYSKELSPRFFLHHTTTDGNYWLSFAKVRLKNTVFLEERRKNVDAPAGIYVDIFPFDYAPDCNSAQAKRKWRYITWINNYIYGKVTGHLRTSRSGALLNPYFSLWSIKKLSLHRDKLMRSFDKGDRRYYVDLAGGRALDNSYFPIDKILPLRELPFGKTTVKAPADPNHYLLKLYTERYKIIPPKDQQITHEPVLIRFEDGTEYTS